MREKIVAQWTAQSLTANVSSASVNLYTKFGYSLQVNNTGTALNGSYKLQMSNDNLNWVDVASSTQAVSALSGTNSLMWNVADVNYLYARLVWTFTSGTGTATTLWNLKGF